MLTRILTAAVGAPLLLLALFFCPPVAWAALVALLCVTGMYEVLSALDMKKVPLLCAAALLFAAAAPFFSYLAGRPWLLLLIGAGYAFLLMSICVFFHAALPLEKAATIFFVSGVCVLSMAALAYLRREPNGVFYTLLAIAIPWMSDIGAYFTGTFLGKHKLCPRISPKKTVEGLIGGWAFSVGGALLIAWIYSLLCDAAPLYLRIALAALVCAPVSVIGDLFASVLKRQNGLKDYGKLFPGHGGVMDRFDSLTAVTLFLLAVVQVWPLIG